MQSTSMIHVLFKSKAVQSRAVTSTLNAKQVQSRSRAELSACLTSQPGLHSLCATMCEMVRGLAGSTEKL